MKSVGDKLSGGRSSSGGSSSAAGSAEPTRATAKKASIRHPRLQALGFLVLFGGAIILGLSFVITKTVLTWAIWGGAIVFVGTALIIIARQR
jgi:hypothetical protein